YWFKAGKSFHDRLINAFAVQFSKSILFCARSLGDFPSVHHRNRFCKSFFQKIFSRSAATIQHFIKQLPRSQHYVFHFLLASVPLLEAIRCILSRPSYEYNTFLYLY
ncbi:hypothetical protein, partial [uncultured Brevibacillus sp.]|uniref:hypothetical protein n=1 Tax=uncultured Brevibacillus sp. TaxID=169970 RepID=UPI002596061C